MGGRPTDDSLMHQALESAQRWRELDIRKKANWPDSEHYFKNLPKPMLSVRTNSEGKFSLSLPKTGRFALVAQGKREEPAESYYWMTWVSLDGADKKSVILGNHNLTTSGSQESIIAIKSN
jgi:hypothetical protein